MKPSIGIIGAGITGLAITHFLRESDVETIAFERQAVPGGVIKTTAISGIPLDCGPQRTRNTELISSMISSLGLKADTIHVSNQAPLYIFSNGKLRLVPQSLGDFVRTDLLTTRGKLRMLMEPFVGKGNADETVSNLFKRKFGPEVYQKIVRPLYGGIYASDPERMPARYGLTGSTGLAEARHSLLLEAGKRLINSQNRPPAISFREGMAQLPSALYEANSENVQLNESVRSITASNGGYNIDTGTRSVQVDRVILTTPATTTAQLLSTISPSASVLDRLTYNSLVLVHLIAEHNRRGFGYKIPRTESLRTLGVTWSGNLFDRNGVNTCFFGGMDDQELLEESDAKIASIASEEFKTVMGIDGEPINITRLPNVIPAYDHTWSELSKIDLPNGIEIASNFTGRIGIPARIEEAKRLASRMEAIEH